MFCCASTAGWHHHSNHINRNGLVSTCLQNRHSRVERLHQTSPNIDETTTSSSSSTSPTAKPYPVLKHSLLAILIATTGLLFGQPQEGFAAGGWVGNLSPTTLFSLSSTVNKEVLDATSTTNTIFEPQQSPGWEAARAKRTAAMKELERKKIVKVDTDDAGNQFLELPWVPARKVNLVTYNDVTFHLTILLPITTSIPALETTVIF